MKSQGSDSMRMKPSVVVSMRARMRPLWGSGVLGVCGGVTVGGVMVVMDALVCLVVLCLHLAGRRGGYCMDPRTATVNTTGSSSSTNADKRLTDGSASPAPARPGLQIHPAIRHPGHLPVTPLLSVTRPVTRAGDALEGGYGGGEVAATGARAGALALQRALVAVARLLVMCVCVCVCVCV